MPTFSDAEILLPKGWHDFEEIVCSAAKNRWKSPDFTRHGRQGQAQDGVDIYGLDANGSYIGIQCKNTSDGLKKKTIEDEIANAESFDPKLSKLYIATTARTDRSVQHFARTISDNRRASGKFEVHILFWNDIWQDLCLDTGRLFSHYPQLRPIHVVSHDLALFNQFKADLAFDPTMDFLKDHDFGGTFTGADVVPLRSFLSVWNRPEKEFNDPVLQTKFAELSTALASFSKLLAFKTYPLAGADRYSVYQKRDHDMGEHPKYGRDNAELLNDQATIAYHLYVEFIRLAQTILQS